MKKYFKLFSGNFILFHSILFSILIFSGNPVFSKENCISAKEISTRINKTLKYFRNIGEEKLETDVKILLPYLEEKFNITIFKTNYKPPLDSLPLLYRFVWLYKQGTNWKKLPESVKESTRLLLYNEYQKKSIDAFTIYSCLCDKINLPQDFYFRLDDKINMGRYELTHAALQYKNLQLSHCVSDTLFEQKKMQIETKIINDILLPIFDYYRSYDLKIEAAVLLYYLESKWIKDKKIIKTINSLMQYQLDSGGWQTGPEYKEEQHTSLLALWLLLEMKNE